MSKNKKKNKNAPAKAVKVEQAEVKADEIATTDPSTETAVAETEPKTDNATADVKVDKKDGKAVEVKAKDVDKNKKKEKNKKPNKVAKALKDTGSELKKVTWPKFSEVVKQTGIVLVVVIVFAVVLLGLDQLCLLLSQLLIK